MNSPVWGYKIPMISRCFVYYLFYVCKITVIYVFKKSSSQVLHHRRSQLFTFEIYQSQCINWSDLLVIFVHLSQSLLNIDKQNNQGEYLPKQNRSHGEFQSHNFNFFCQIKKYCENRIITSKVKFEVQVCILTFKIM